MRDLIIGFIVGGVVCGGLVLCIVATYVAKAMPTRFL